MFSRKRIGPACLVIAITLIPLNAWAQQGGGGDAGGGLPDSGTVPTGTGGATGLGGGGGGGGGASGLADQLDLTQNLTDVGFADPNIVNERLNHPFVGASSENTFHPFSLMNVGNGLLEMGTTGGGAAGGGGINPFGTAGGNGGGNLGGFGGGGIFSNTPLGPAFIPFNQLQQGGNLGNGFQVSRRNVRSSVRPLISNTTISDAQRTMITSNRFEQRLERLPMVGFVPGSVTVQMRGRTLILDGMVESPEVRERIERIAHLEPGVTAVENRIRLQTSLNQPVQRRSTVSR